MARPPRDDLLGGVTAVDENGLAGHPSAIRDQKADEGHDVLDVGQVPHGEFRQGRRRLVIGLGVGAFRRIEGRRVHRARADGGHRNAAVAEFLRRRPREMLDRRLRAGIAAQKGV